MEKIRGTLLLLLLLQILREIIDVANTHNCSHSPESTPNGRGGPTKSFVIRKCAAAVGLRGARVK